LVFQTLPLNSKSERKEGEEGRRGRKEGRERKEEEGRKRKEGRGRKERKEDEEGRKEEDGRTRPEGEEGHQVNERNERADGWVEGQTEGPMERGGEGGGGSYFKDLIRSYGYGGVVQ
jgi:hypothetical protein